MPSIRPIVTLLKYYLRLRGYNETFTGGMSSFLLFNLFWAYLQHLAYKYVDYELELMDYGKLLIGFFEYYIFDFNHLTHGISLRNGGFTFLKKDNNKLERNNMLCVEYFQNPYIDIGKGAYLYPVILDSFNKALIKLKKNNGSHSYLSPLFNADH